MKNILFVSTNKLTKLGGVRRLYFNLKFFRKYFSVHYIYIHLPEQRTIGELDIPRNIKFKQIIAKNPEFDFLACLFPQIAQKVMKIRSVKTQVQEYITSEKIDVVVLHAIDTVLALRDITADVIVAEVLDSFYTYYETKYDFTRNILTFILMNFQKFSYSLMEVMLRNKFDLAVFVSSIDAKKSRFVKSKVIVSEIRPPPQQIRKYVRKYDVAIIGRWDHPPNRDGLKKIFKSLGEISGSVLVVGPGLSYKIEAPKNTRVLGFVDDIEDILNNTKICLIPVWYGAGIQNKAFDALRCGCVIVSTEFTKRTLEKNGFFTDVAYYSEDLIATTNSVLKEWNKKMAMRAYDSYLKWYKKSMDETRNYVEVIKSKIRGEKK